MLMKAAEVALGAWMRGRPLTGPLSVQLSICDACNYRCIMCWDHPPEDRRVSGMHPSSGAVMDPDMFEGIIADLVRLGTLKVRLIGRGEPTLNPHWLDMIALATARGLACDMTTNAARLTPALAQELADKGLKALTVSLNSATPETYRLIATTCPAGRWEAIVESLKAYCNHRRSGGRPAGVTLSFVISSLNVHEVAAMADLARSVKADRLLFQMVQAHPKATDLLLDEAGRRELAAQGRELGRWCAERGIEHNIDFVLKMSEDEARLGTTWSRLVYAVVPCYVGYYFSLILASGEVLGCCACDEPLGNVRDGGFSGVWTSARYQEYRRDCLTLPQRATPLPKCACFDCGMARHNASLGRLLHPLRAARLPSSKAGFRVSQLWKRF